MSVLPLISKLKKLDIHIELVDDKLKLNAPEGALTPELLDELKEWKGELIEFLQRKFQRRVKLTSRGPSEKKEYYVLSSAQKRLYILQQMAAGNISYNLSFVLLLEGDIDIEKLETAFKKLAARHESLRTSFEIVNGEPVQKIHDYKEVDFAIEYISVERKTESVEKREEAEIIQDFVRPFDLSWAPLLRVGVIAIEKQKHLLMVNMHHIITDGMSQTLLTNEFGSLYAGGVLFPLRLQYKDYAEWQQSQAVKEVLKQEEGYWLEQFKGEIPVLNLFTDFPRPTVQSFEGRSLDFNLSIRETNALKEIARSQEATLFMILLAVYNIMLYKLSSQEDVIVGTAIAGRIHADLEGVIGMFVNTLALRNYPSGKKRFDTLLKEVKDRTLEAFENQDYPFEELVEKVEGERDASRNPVFDAAFALQNVPGTAIETSGQQVEVLKIKPYDYENRTSKFDLTLFANEWEEGLYLIFEYCSKLFKEETIFRFINYFKNITAAVIDNTQIKIADIEIVSEQEKEQLLVEFNDTTAAYPEDKTIHELFAGQVKKSPDHVTVTCGDKQLSYGELNRQCNRLARALRKQGVKADTVVGIKVERSPAMVVAILAILKAGGAYLPIDPAYPRDRVRGMLDDCRVSTLITEADKEGQHDLRVLNHPRFSNNIITGEAIEVLPEEGDEDLMNINRPSDLAYIIFTSGSTGQPKGSLIDHRNVVRLMFNDRYLFDFTGSDVWTLFHSYCFDFSVWEMYGALLYGGKLVVVPKMVSRDPEMFLKILKKEGVTVLNQVPSAFYHLSEQELSHGGRELNLRYIIFGGEALKPSKLKGLREKYPGIRFINMFGITETTVHVTFKELGDKEIDLNISNIGRPIPTLSTYVVDKHLHLHPLGVAGELLVGGEGVGRGYLNRVELTREKFIINPYKAGERLYRSGDLVRLRGEGEGEGELEYLGRIDQQVKIRGFRIELGEIENRLSNFAGVKEAVVLDSEDVSGDKRLAAYIVPDGEYAYPVRRWLNLESKGYTSDKQCYELPNGMMVFYINRNETDFMYREIFAEQSYLRHGIVLKDGACIVDVGANIGVFTLFAHYMCRDAKIYSFEPLPPLYELLELNTSLYGINAKIFKCGLFSEPGEADFTYYPHNTVLSGCFADIEEEKDTVKAFIANQEADASKEQVEELLDDRLSSSQYKCELSTLSQVIGDEGIERIDLLKIDVEKSEIEVLGGIREEDWGRIGQVVIEVHNIDGRLDNITGLLERQGFKVRVEQDRVLENTDLYNVYAVRPGEGDGEVAGSDNDRLVRRCRWDLGRYWSSPARLKSDARVFLQEMLPDYMVPSSFVLVEEIPLTANDKVDRKWLRAIEIKGTVEHYIAPQDEVEEKLAEIWSEILGIEKNTISTDSNFFELGGHSLKATILASKIHKELDVRLPLAEIFKSPTIRGIGDCIRKASIDRFTAILAVEKREFYELSSAERRLYVLQQIVQGSTAYNISGVYRVEGEVDVKKWKTGFKKLIDRHEALRTSFHLEKGKPVQKITDEIEFEIEYFEATGKTHHRLLCPADIIQDFVRSFDLSHAPLLRFGLIKTTENEHILMLDMHHIISDGISISVLVNDFMTLYSGGELFPLRIQYKDYSQWQNSGKGSEFIQRQEQYWAGEFEEGIPVLDLPADYKRSVVQSFEGSILHFEIDKEHTLALKQIALEQGATLFMILLSIYTICLSKIANQENIIVGTPIAGRKHADLEKIMGMFINMLALQNFPGGHKVFNEFLVEVKTRTLEAFANQDYQYDELVEILAVDRSTSHNPLFDTVFALQNLEISGVEITGLRITPYEYESGLSKFDLTLFAMETETSLLCSFEYCTKLFKEETIKKFIRYFKNTLFSVIRGPGARISEIEIITAEEKQQILFCFNDDTRGYPTEKTLHGLFQEQVKRTPDYAAVVHEGEYLSYKELNRRTDRLAGVLGAKGVRADTIVALTMKRSAALILGILAIMKAGGVYVPINPKLPESRKKYILDDSVAKLLLTHRGWGETLKDVYEIVEVEDETLYAGDVEIERQGRDAGTVTAGNFAYMIYTSGSTGNPKGVPITHANISPLLHWGYHCLEIAATNRCIQNLPYFFDWSVWEIFITITTGAVLYAVDDEVLLNPEDSIDFIKKNDITMLHITPTHFQYFLNVPGDLKTLKYLFIGAEKLADYVARGSYKLVNEDCRIFNMYGPTEATIISAVLELDRSNDELYRELTSVPIGKPAANLTLLVLDKYLNMCPVGVKGDLYINGDGVARGYLNNPERTSAAFIKNSLQTVGVKGNCLYNTGDLVRWLPNGDIEFLGRIDHQVKIRGHRIELGEIINALLLHDGVKEAEVILKDRIKKAAIDGTDLPIIREGDQYLCAYIVPQGELDFSQLKSHLAGTLPEYMIPSSYIRLSQMPLNPNGKIDRKKLLAIEAEINLEAEEEPPTDEVEKQLVRMWRDVLGVERIGINNNFFDLGGHSLRATILVSRIRKEFNVEFPLSRVFSEPTIKEFAKFIRNQTGSTAADINHVEKREYYPLSSAQKRVFSWNQLETIGSAYNVTSVYKIPGKIDKPRLENAFKALIRRHESLRTSFLYVGGKPVQRIHDSVQFEIQDIDIGTAAPGEAHIKEAIKTFKQPFDLAAAPLLRVGLITLPGHEGIFIFDIHHIISDGASMGILMRDFAYLYEGDDLPLLDIQYKDFSAWQNHLLRTGKIKKQEKYWLNLYSGEIPVLKLPEDYPRPTYFNFAGGRFDFYLQPEDTSKFHQLNTEQGVTLFISLYAAINVLFYKYTGQEDIILGSSVFARPHDDLRNIVGVFMDKVAIRNYPGGRKRYSQLLQEVKTNIIEAFENQDMPFQELIEKLNLKKEFSQAPLFNVAVEVQNVDSPEFELKSIRFDPYTFQDNTSKYDMSIFAQEVNEEISFNIVYYTEIFKKETIERLADHLLNIIKQVNENPDILIDDLEIPGNREPALADAGMITTVGSEKN